MDAVYPSLDLNFCVQEPIHAPGSIQPHGMMLVACVAKLRVTHVAGDVEDRLGLAQWNDRPLQELIGDMLFARVAALARPGGIGGFMGQLRTQAGELLDVSANVSGSWILVELETASVETIPTVFILDALAEGDTGFEQAITIVSLCERAAVAFRQLTRFDRVMIYRFLEDNSGEVVAEDRRADMRPLLHQHFPASDIPRQARDLYLRNRLRVIPDRGYQPLPLRPYWTAQVPLDMSDCSLRSVSPVHLEYLANMGVCASASMSIVRDNLLWGLVACHSETPQILTYDIRAACRALAGSLGRQIKAKEEAEGYRQRIRLRSFEDDIVRSLLREPSLEDALGGQLAEIGRMMASDGVAMLRGQELVTVGACPGELHIRALAVWLCENFDKPVVTTECLSDSYAPAAAFQNFGSGLLAIVLSAAEPWLVLCFRAEQAQTVTWAGNPHKDVTADRQTQLTPRTSFEAWRETVRGKARRWIRPEVEAAGRLATALLDAQQNRRVVQLNAQLTAILKDKEQLLQQKAFLMGEVNHRVQNSLQLVSSFLTLQARSSNNPELIAELAEARRRLNAVALVHRRLYSSDQVETVEIARYIEELCTDTLSFMGREWADHLSLSLAPAMVSTDQAITLGLVLLPNC